MRRSLVPEGVERYVSSEITRETRLQRRLRAETSALPHAGMQISADQGAFLALLARTIGAQHALEIGTFTGNSALAVAAALPHDGKLICCDVNEEWTNIARRYWAEAGLTERVELRLGPAIDTLTTLLRTGSEGAFDFAFIDADKPAYDAYYEACLKLLRPGGVIALDNMLWSGSVADPHAHDHPRDAGPGRRDSANRRRCRSY